MCRPVQARQKPGRFAVENSSSLQEDQEARSDGACASGSPGSSSGSSCSDAWSLEASMSRAQAMAPPAPARTWAPPLQSPTVTSRNMEAQGSMGATRVSSSAVERGDIALSRARSASSPVTPCTSWTAPHSPIRPTQVGNSGEPALVLALPPRVEPDSGAEGGGSASVRQPRPMDPPGAAAAA